MSSKKYKVSDYMPGVGYLIEQYSGKIDHFDKVESFSCIVSFNCPVGAPITDSEIEKESLAYANEVCAALNAKGSTSTRGKQVEKCLSCGVEKDINSLEVYPYEGDCIITDEPVQPLIDIECQSVIDHTDFRLASICHSCFHKVQPDMWMSAAEWKSLKPNTAFSDLPKLKDRPLVIEEQETLTETKERA